MLLFLSNQSVDKAVARLADQVINAEKPIMVQKVTEEYYSQLGIPVPEKKAEDDDDDGDEEVAPPGSMLVFSNGPGLVPHISARQESVPAFIVEPEGEMPSPERPAMSPMNPVTSPVVNGVGDMDLSDSDMALATSSSADSSVSGGEPGSPGTDTMDVEEDVPPGTEVTLGLEVEHERVSDDEFRVENEPEPGVPGDDTATDLSSMDVDEESVPSPPGEGTSRLVQLSSI